MTVPARVFLGQAVHLGRFLFDVLPRTGESLLIIGEDNETETYRVRQVHHAVREGVIAEPRILVEKP